MKNLNFVALKKAINQHDIYKAIPELISLPIGNIYLNADFGDLDIRVRPSIVNITPWMGSMRYSMELDKVSIDDILAKLVEIDCYSIEDASEISDYYEKFCGQREEAEKLFL